VRSREIPSTGANRPSGRSLGFLRVLSAAALLALTTLFLTSPPALARTTHPLIDSFSIPCNSETVWPEDIALHYSTNTVYVMCPEVSGGYQRTIIKYDTAGNPVDFTANQPSYIKDNTIFDNPDPASEGNHFDTDGTIAVDNSGGPNDGDIFVTSPEDSQDVNVFAPTGKWLGTIPTPTAVGEPKGITVDGNGYVYVLSAARVSKYDQAFNEVARFYVDPARFTYPWHDNNDYLRVDSTGGLWALHQSRSGGNGALYRYEADQLQSKFKPLTGPADVVTPAALSPYAQEPMLTNLQGMDVDPSNDDLYVVRRTTFNTSDPIPSTIRPFSPALPGDPAHQTGPEFGSLAGSWALAVAPDGTIYALNNNDTVNVYAAGDIVPTATTNPSTIDDEGHTSAIVTGKVDPAGGDDVTGCQVQYGTQYDTYDIGSVPCTPDPSGGNFSAPTDISATLPGLSTGQTYHYRVIGSNAHGQGWGGDREVSAVAVLHLHTGAATDVDPDSATLHGSLNPDSMNTTYRFDYGLSTDYRQSTADLGPLSGGSDTPVSIPVADLQSGKTYHYRLVGVNSLGTTFGPDATFKTAAPPEISGVRATGLSSSGATLNARINPESSATTYHFEYGTTTDYGTDVPAAGDAGSGDTEQAVSVDLHDLQPGVTYHFRVVATNQWGTSTSDDTTFSFAPPSCPNEHIRQQTGANFLPDCRAYELVTPEKQGSAVFWPSDETLDFGGGFGLGSVLSTAQWPQNTGQATNPPRFAFYGGLGSVPGLDAPNSLLDTYLTTRTSQGWVTTFPGIKGSEQLYTGRRMCSETLDKCIDHIAVDGVAGAWPDENAPFAFDASGKALGRWPTNVNSIPGGNLFFGDQQPSGDFRHFVFSSRDLAFAPGGASSPPGSAYDNDTVDRTVTIISKLPNGDDIPQDGGNQFEVIVFPAHGVSQDGSHILMSTVAGDGPQHLYMRVDDAVTYDVSKGFGVHYVGMTRDGSKVIFSAVQQVTPDDTDTSLDLYEWSEEGDTVTLISTGNGNGNSDACNASYTTQCDADPLSTEAGLRGGWEQNNPQNGQFLLPGIDSQIATGNGAVYFYSPESLDPNRLSTPNERNLYVYRDGAVHFIATLDPGTQVNRIQISPDGVHGAFLTEAKLTGYDNKGFREMYTYDDSTGALRCASCDPSGLPPAADVLASQGGPFMSDDGRAFFSTPDPLVPQDTDGIIDVYEFVDGRPQLISTGTGTRDFSVTNVVQFFYVPEHIGLEAVSADGMDVYFSTYDTLVQQDQNGNVLKFYDARTNGGFEPPAPLAPCVAADECHGPGSSPTNVPTLPTGADHGGGNVQPVASKRRKKKSNRQRRHKRHLHRHRGQGNG
jgi:hypothetical protein